MKPNELPAINRGPKPASSGTAVSAVALAKAISGDTLIGVPGKPLKLPSRAPETAQAVAPQAPAPTATRPQSPLPSATPAKPAGTAFPAYLVAGGTTAPQPASTTTPPMPVAVEPAPVYRGSDPGSSAGVIRAITLMVKFGITAAIIGGIGYFTMTSVVPVLKEMSNPTPASAGVDKDAPVFVQAIQQTRQVVAKNDANVARLDALIAENEGTAVTQPPAPTAQLAAPAAPGAPAPGFDPNQQPIPDSAFAGPPAEPVSVSIYSPGSPVEVNFVIAPGSDMPKELMEAMAERVTGFQVNGIRHGTTPRIVVGGVLFKPGDMVDYQLELTFLGVDTRKRLIMFKTPGGDRLTRTY